MNKLEKYFWFCCNHVGRWDMVKIMEDLDAKCLAKILVADYVTKILCVWQWIITVGACEEIPQNHDRNINKHGPFVWDNGKT